MNKWPIKTLANNFKLIFGIYVVFVVAFLALMYTVHNGNTLSLDETVLRYINQSATPFWDNFYLTVTRLGGYQFIAPATAILTLWLISKSARYKATFILATVAGAGLLNALMKLSVGRERPSLWQQLVNEHSYSFPSGHAMNSTALAISLIVLFWNTRWRWAVSITSFAYFALVGYSRLYLGVHYPSDIAGGWLVAIIWAMSVAGILCAHYWRRERNPKKLSK